MMMLLMRTVGVEQGRETGVQRRSNALFFDDIPFCIILGFLNEDRTK